MKTYSISNIPQEELSKSGRYNPSPEEREYLRELAKRAGIRTNVRYNTPRKKKNRKAVSEQNNEPEA